MAEADSTVTYKDIPGFPGYRVGDNGTVLSCWNRAWPEGITHRLKAGETAWRMTEQWWIVRPKLVREKGKFNIEVAGQTLFVHRLVLLTFVGPCPDGMMCCHENGIGTDNRLANLRWDTPKANAADRDRHGRTVRGSRVYGAKLTEDRVRLIHADNSIGRYTQRELARKHSVTQATISDILRGRIWKHVIPPLVDQA